jgi:hypothetical protein
VIEGGLVLLVEDVLLPDEFEEVTLESLILLLTTSDTRGPTGGGRRSLGLVDVGVLFVLVPSLSSLFLGVRPFLSLPFLLLLNHLVLFVRLLML